MKAETKVEGVDQIKSNLAKLADKYGQEAARGAFKAAKLIEGDAKKSIQSQSSGETVERNREGGQKYVHVVSKEGDAPNTDTGALVASIQTEVTPKGIWVGSRLDYSAHLEFGTSSMAARPWLFPAIEKNRTKIKELIKKSVDKITRDHNNGR